MPEPNEGTPPKVTFSPEQQVKLDEILREAQGRAGNDARATAARLESELAKVRSELQAAKDAAATASGDVVKAKDAEIEKAKAETVAVRKENAIRQAAETYGFFNSAQVLKLTEQDIKWDGEKNRFVVLGENGSPRLGLDGSTPLSLDEFYADFSRKNTHLVKGEVKPGIGSKENQITRPAPTEREKISRLFGKGSDAVACNRLALSDPAEFKRQRYLAKSYGLV
jgi:ElaB/YqjD/DUF883 family membrane-anchored ribosome-binding protein